MNIKLGLLNKPLKNFLLTYIIILTIGVTLGLTFINHTTSMTSSGAIERFNGSKINPNDEFDIRENYPKPIQEMLITTHNHVFGFSFIFFSIGLIFYFNSIITGFLKSFLMIEPFFSIVFSFGSIWLMRYVNEGFVYLIIVSALMMYISFYVMAGVSIFELKFERRKHSSNR